MNSGASGTTNYIHGEVGKINLIKSLSVSAPGEPDADGAFSFQLLRAAGGAAFDVTLDITTSGGGVPAPGSWTFFNPQPELPNFLNGAAAAGFAFQFSSFSLATVVMQIRDSQGNLLSFVDAPEPGTIVLVALGLLGFAAFRKSALRA